ncbi:hypothetical protein INT44_008856 [Umbelopsis vinacea]|uniref:Yeast cell wall synthesis Kre9/Knh1-like N-terminal domain-containing protein n=1 Tax=Umbelopsis vinacea TaxID=44442 RepID=A0A8H7UI18_9FUNG|nr:hypothetical protein INT44_008856 [Umbelopsis vinacea]
MVSYTLISTVFAAIATAVSANMAPSEPAPNTIWTTGQSSLIQWADDSTSPPLATDWKKFKIDLMTGDNTNQIFLTNVATGLDGTAATTLNWTAPDVDVHSAIYFLMFTSLTKATDMAWTTRFAIVGADGVQTAPANAAQPDKSTLDGKPIPWGVGHLVNSASGSAATNSVIASTAPALSLSNAAPAATSSGAAVSAAGASQAASSPSTSQKSSASKVLATAGLGLAAVAAVMMAM